MGSRLFLMLNFEYGLNVFVKWIKQLQRAKHDRLDLYAVTANLFNAKTFKTKDENNMECHSHILVASLDININLNIFSWSQSKEFTPDQPHLSAQMKLFPSSDCLLSHTRLHS